MAHVAEAADGGAYRHLFTLRSDLDAANQRIEKSLGIAEGTGNEVGDGVPAVLPVVCLRCLCSECD